MCDPTNEETSKPATTTKFKEIIGKLAKMVCAPCEPQVKEAHGHVMSKVEDVKKRTSMAYDDSKVKVTEIHGNVSSKIKEVSDKASATYVEHVDPKVKKVQEIHANVTSKLKDVSDKTSASYKDNVAPHVEKLSTTASATYNEKIVPAAKKVGDKAAATFNETVVPKVKEHTAKLKAHAEPKLKELNDKAAVKMQEGKVYASTACTEFSDKVVAAICTPKVKEFHEKVKESEAARKISKAYDDHGAPKIKSFKEGVSKMAAMVCADLASTVKYYKG